MAFYTRKIVSDQFVGPLDGTATSASYATTASSLASGATASLAVSASYSSTASYVESASYAFTATSASWALTASYVSGSSISSSYAATASYLDALATASYALTASYVLSSSYATTASFVLSSSYALSSSVAESASFATTASYVLSSSYALSSSLAESASFATSASYTLSSSFATSASLATSASRAVSASLATSASYLINTVYDREIHVSNVSGNDSGSGTLLQPVKTIGRAMALLTSNGSKVIIHPGTYQENVTLTAANATITAPSPEQGGIVLISGSFTINNNSTSNRIAGITANHWVITGSGNIYLDQIRANHSFSKIGAGYMEVLNSGIQPSQGMVVSAGTNNFLGGNIAGLVQSGASTITIVKNALSLTYANITAGTFAVTDSPVYSLTSGSAAIVSSAGTIVQLINAQIATPTGVPERVALSGFYGYSDLSFNRAASTLSANNLNLTADFQTIRANTIIGTASIASTASTADSFFVRGDLMVNGTASFKQVNFLSSSIVYSSGSTKFGDSLDDTHQFTGSLFVTGSITGTASYATQASQSYLATSASFATTASYVLSSSYATTASFVVSASIAETASFVLSSSYSVTASYLDTLATASYALTASNVVSSSYAATASFVESSSFATSASIAQTASFVVSSSYSTTASYLDVAATASYALTASYLDVFATASYALTASLSTTASNALTASYLDIYATASYALTASYLSGSVTVDTGSLVTTSSFNAYTSSLATTGSNQFTADQIITGSMTVSASLVISDWRLYISGSNLAVEKWDGIQWVQSGYFEV